MTRELPINLPPHDIRKLLDGTKTQTRRIVKLPKGLNWSDFDSFEIVNREEVPRLSCRGRAGAISLFPRYVPGSVLWVREAFLVAGTGCVFYRADGEELADGFGWIPSVQMPKEIARIFLRVEEVRVERVQDISEEDAEAEGVGPFLMGYAGVSADNMTEIESYRASFEDLWNTIHGEGAWSRNDWVWVYRFSRIENYRAAA